jgi:predicted component of type VI protein secretion system
MKPGALATVMLATMLTAVAVAGCGSSSPGITEDASNQLQLQVQAVRNAATTRDPSLAQAHLAELRRTVTQLRDRHKISGDRATKVLDAAAQVETQLQTIPTTTTTTTTTVTPPPPARDKGDHGKDKKGKGGG